MGTYAAKCALLSLTSFSTITNDAFTTFEYQNLRNSNQIDTGSSCITVSKTKTRNLTSRNF